MEYLIRNAEIFDGTGTSPFHADVCLKDGVIACIGSATPNGCRVIDGAGYALAPGFIDAHGHSELDILDIPGGDNKIAQGFTSEIAGNCGFTEFMEKGLSFAQYRERFREKAPALNLAVLAGHNSLRTIVIGNDDRKASDTERMEMRRLLRDAIRQGAKGFSAGMWYVPGIYADTDEVAFLAEELKGTRLPFTIHLRSEGDTLLESIREACAIARAGNGILQISHFKTWYPRNWHKLADALQLIEQEKQNGLQIHLDRYPYLYSGTGLRMALPAELSRIPKETLHKQLKEDPEFFRHALALTEAAGPADCPWEQILLLDSGTPEHAPYFGRTMSDIAAERGLSSPAEACLKLLAEEENPLGGFGLMSEQNLNTILARKDVMPGTDGGIQDFNKQNGHPRKFGTAPRFFQLASRYAPVETVIQRMTALPATVFQLERRGIIDPGYHADLVLFHKNEFNANEDYAHPATPAPGLRFVFVNGEPVLDEGKRTDKRPGVLL